MARYAISPEGANALNALANNLLINANNIVEASSVLKKEVATLSGSLGVFEEEILSVVSRNAATLEQNKESIISLANSVKAKADEVAQLYLLEPDNKKTGFFHNIANRLRGTTTTNKAPAANKPQYTDINDIPQEEFDCISKYNGDSERFNEPIRAGKTTKETKLFSKMISERVLADSKTLYRRATLADLNGLYVDMNDLGSLSGQQFNFCGFMSTSPDAKLPNDVSHGNVFFEFSAPTGVNALDLSSLMYNEVIFDSPLCQIDHAERRGNDIYIIASIK